MNFTFQRAKCILQSSGLEPGFQEPPGHMKTSYGVRKFEKIYYFMIGCNYLICA
jgi:hypothetical protein